MNEILMKRYRIKILPAAGARFAIINIPRIAQDVAKISGGISEIEKKTLVVVLQ